MSHEGEIIPVIKIDNGPNALVPEGLIDCYLDGIHIKELDIKLESEIYISSLTLRHIKCDIKISISEKGYFAQVNTDKYLFQNKGVLVISEMICQGSHYQTIKFYLHNTSNKPVYLSRGDIVGQLSIFKCPIESVMYKVEPAPLHI